MEAMDTLLIDLILENIFTHLSCYSGCLKVLLNCRLVCHTWNDIATPTILKVIHKFKLVFENEDGRNPESKLQRYLTHLNKNQPCIVLPSNFLIWNMWFKEHDQNPFDNFFTGFGHTVRYLELRHTGRTVGFFDSKDIYKVLSQCEDLIQLQVDERNRFHIQTSTIESLKGFKSNIKKLKLELNFGDQEEEKCCEFLKYLLNATHVLEEANVDVPHTQIIVSSLLSSPCTRTLTHLTLSAVHIDELDDLARLHLRHLILIKLTLNLERDEKFFRILLSQSETLETFSVCLQINLTPNQQEQQLQSNSIRFPVMQKLRVLKLDLGVFRNPAVEFFPVNFSVQFPVLEHFSLQGRTRNCNIGAFLPGDNILPQLNVNCLEIPGDAGVTEIMEAKRVFPEVKHLMLKTGFNIVILPKVWMLWSNLETLLVSGNVTDDDGGDRSFNSILTGLHEKECEKYVNLGKDLMEMKDLKPTTTSPSIADLKKLKALAITDFRSKMNNVTLWTLSQLRGLEYVVFKMQNTISQEEAKIFCETIPHMQCELLNNRHLLCKRLHAPEPFRFADFQQQSIS